MVCSLSIIYFILSLVSLHEQSLTSLHAKSSPVPIKRRQSSNKSITSPFTSPVSVILCYKYIFSPLPHSFLLSLSSFLPSSLSLVISLDLVHLVRNVSLLLLVLLSLMLLEVVSHIIT